jgi:hypothetical protein
MGNTTSPKMLCWSQTSPLSLHGPTPDTEPTGALLLKIVSSTRSLAGEPLVSPKIGTSMSRISMVKPLGEPLVATLEAVPAQSGCTSMMSSIAALEAAPELKLSPKIGSSMMYRICMVVRPLGELLFDIAVRTKKAV